MTIYLASGNPHKRAEIAAILGGHELKTPADLGIPFDPVEDGSTFLENSLIKARALYNILRAPVIADDSGICVKALDGRPGIRSARYGNGGGRNLDAPARNALLLSELGDRQDRSAFFVCSAVFMVSPDRFFAVQETLEGEILRDGRGSGGFGYDPIMYLPKFGRTVAELSGEEKNLVSHRGLAVRRLASLIETL